MRVFFALEPPGALAIQLADWRDKQLPALGRPVPPGNFHITLAFLGNISEQELERLCLETDELLSRRTLEAGTVQLNQLGYWHKNGIFWLGPCAYPPTLKNLASALESRGVAVGARRKRSRYSPHVTLFRGCHEPPPAPAQEPNFNWPYDSFTLLESRMSDHGVSYHPLAEWKLSPASGATDDQERALR
ncbi:MAG: RNA 2',3'-cyclic phosphodiesterase [Halioglobus sp.]